MNSFQTIVSIIRKHKKQITGELTMDSLLTIEMELDSLELLNILVEIEDTFHIIIPEDIAVDFTTLGDLVCYVDSLTTK